MKPIQTSIAFVVLCLSAHAVVAEDSFQPLDTRTRCIVLFRECLVLMDQKDVDGIFECIADGSGSNFKLYPDTKTLSPDLKRELQDTDKFFKHNFKKTSTIKSVFNKILFSELVTAKDSVSVSNTATGETEEAKLHSIKIKIPEIDRSDFTELRFVEIADKIYWVPFGW